MFGVVAGNAGGIAMSCDCIVHPDKGEISAGGVRGSDFGVGMS